MVRGLFKRNWEWSEQRRREEPGYFARFAAQQRPEFFWIGCSDSRVPRNVIAGLDPGEVFVHHNVAKVVHTADANLLTALEFAIEALEIRTIVVCGHYGCGGMEAATENFSGGQADHWLAPVRRLAAQEAAALGELADAEARRDRLAEMNVREGVRPVAETSILAKVWARGDAMAVHGLIYGLVDGRLRDLDCTLTGAVPPGR